MPSCSLLLLKRKPWLLCLLLLAPLAAINLTVFVLPVAELIGISFIKGSSSGVLTSTHTIGNYISFLSDPYYLELIPTSLAVSFIATLAALICSYPIALFLYRAPARWRNILFVITVSPLLVSSVVRTFGWMSLLGDQGVINAALLYLGIIRQPLELVNNYIGVFIGLVEILMPYMALCLIAGFGRLDNFYEEAAASLGASPFYRLWYVIFPFDVPGVMLGCLLCFVLALSAFVTPKLLGGGRVFLLATEIYDQAVVQLQWPMAATISVVILVLFTVALIGYSRLLRRVEA